MFKTYDYICSNEHCQMSLAEVEVLVSTGEEDLQRCETCKGKLRRILSSIKGYVKGTDNPTKC